MFQALRFQDYTQDGISHRGLISRVRALADIRGSQFQTDDEIQDLISDSFDMLFMSLVDLNEGYWTKVTDPAPPTNGNQILFPDDLYKIRIIERYESPGNVYPLRERRLREAKQTTDGFFDFDYLLNRPFGYVLFPNRAEIYPVEGVDGLNFRITYARDPLTINQEAMQKGWEKYLIYKVAYTISVIDDNPKQALGDLALQWERKIKKFASSRDSGPRTIQDLDRINPLSAII